MAAQPSCFGDFTKPMADGIFFSFANCLTSPMLLFSKAGSGIACVTKPWHPFLRSLAGCATSGGCALYLGLSLKFTSVEPGFTRLRCLDSNTELDAVILNWPFAGRPSIR